MSTLLETPPVETPAPTPTPAADPNAAPPSAPVDPSPTPPPVVDWRSTLPEELRSEKSLESFRDVAALAKSYVETKKLVGQRVDLKPPTKDSTPEQIATWRKALGVPDTPDGYLQAGVVRPELAASGEWDEAAESAFLDLAHKNHIPPGFVNATLQFYAKLEADKQAASSRSRQAVASALRTEWGPNYAASLGRANRALQEFGGDEMVTLGRETRLADGSLLGDHPALIKTFAKIGNVLVESGAMDPEGIAAGMSADDAREAIKKKQAEMKALPEGHPRTRELVDEVLALARIVMRG